MRLAAALYLDDAAKAEDVAAVELDGTVCHHEANRAEVVVQLGHHVGEVLGHLRADVPADRASHELVGLDCGPE